MSQGIASILAATPALDRSFVCDYPTLYTYWTDFQFRSKTDGGELADNV
jgi:hypothetical protein